MRIKSKLFAVFCLVMIIFLAGNVNSEESQAQQELAYTYTDAAYYYPSLNSPSNFMTWKNEFCNQANVMDFLVELPPDACSPSPVTSDLLEENDVPVLCRLTGIKINPFIEVPYIKKVTPIVEKQSKEIAYINFYPARSALGSYQFNDNFQVSEGSPTLNNLGYLLIFLKQQPAEKNMSRNVSANIVVNITYDVSKTYGLSTQQFILPITTNEEWPDSYKKYSFWHGRGYLRLQSITGQNAKIAVYSKPDVAPVSVVDKREGQSYSVNMPGFYCDGPVNISVDKIQTPSVKARFNINGNDFLIAEGEEFADSGCMVNRITTQKYFGGEVAVSCQGHVGQGSQGEYTFTVNPLNAKINFSDAVSKDVEKIVYLGDELEFITDNTDNPNTPMKEQKKEYYYVGYIGKTASISTLQTAKYSYSDIAIIFAVDGRTKIDEHGKKEKIIDAIQDAMRNGKMYSTDSSLKQVLNKDSRVNGVIVYLKAIQGSGQSMQENRPTGDVVVGAGLPELVTTNVHVTLLSVEGPVQVYYSKDIEAEYKKVIDYYQTIASQYSRQENEDGYVYGIVSLRKAAELAGYMSKQQDQINLLQSIIDKYQDIDDEYIQAEVEAARDDILLLSEGAGDERSKTIETSSGTYYTSLLSIVKPGLNSQEARIKVNDSDSAAYLIGDEIGLVTITGITEEGIAISIENLNEGTEKKEPIATPDFIKKGTSKTIYKTKIDVVSTLVRKEVKVTVFPFEKERVTTTNFSVVIGIEKRAIQLTPSQISKRIADLNNIINTLDKYVGFLEKTTTLWKKACYAGGTVLWAKNFLSGLSGQSLARRLAMKAWSSKCASEEYRTTLGGSKTIGLSECYRKNKADIEDDVAALTTIVNDANAFVKEVKSKPGVVTTSGLFGLSKQINEEKFVLEAKTLFLSDKYSDLKEDVSVDIVLGQLTKSQKDVLLDMPKIKNDPKKDYCKDYDLDGLNLTQILSRDANDLTKKNKECPIPVPAGIDTVISSLEIVYEAGQISSDDIKDIFLMLSINKKSGSVSETLKDYEGFQLFTKSSMWLDTVNKKVFSKSISKTFEIESQFWAGKEGAEKAIVVSQIYQMTKDKLNWFANDDPQGPKNAEGKATGLTSQGFIEQGYLTKEFVIFSTPKYKILAFLDLAEDNKYTYAPAFSIEEKEIQEGSTTKKLIALNIDETVPKDSPSGTLPARDRILIPLGDDLPTYVLLQDIEKCHHKVNDQDYKIRFWEKGPYEGLVAQMIIQRTEGWYYATKAYSGLEGTMTSYKETGALNEYWICNVGSNGKPEFNFYTGPEGDDDCCYQISKTTSMQIPEAIKALAVNVEGNCVKVAQESYTKKERPIKTGKCGNTQPLGSAPTLIPSTQCEDFMSPDDCQLMFNLCDPVICPPSRCDLSGRYPVENVIQSGIIGSLVLCSGNAGEVAVPICISGLYAGLDALNNMVFKQYKECLQKQLDTGQTTGLCDYWHSVYLCQILWGNLDPFIKAGLPTITQSFSQGGGEYSLFSEALKNSQDSMGYFTEYYGPNAFSSFKARATNQTGTTICDKYVSIVYPTAAKFVDDLTKADSPYSIYASVEEVSLGASPESHYRVFYNIYAGKDQSVSYQVYLKKQGSSSGYEYSIDQIPVRGAQGFLSPGETASNKSDIIAPSGYTQVCVNANGKENCFLGAGGTSFAISEVQNLYLESQIKQNIKTEKECKAGTTTLVPTASLNLQSQLTEALQPAIYKRGIIRICASENPASGTEDTDRYKAIGYCDNQKISCWLDMNSVNNSISDLGIRENIADYADKIAQDKLLEKDLVDIVTVTQSKIDDLERRLGIARETLYGESKDVEQGVGQYNIYLNRIKQELFYQLGLAIEEGNQEQVVASNLDKLKLEIKDHEVVKDLNSIAQEADKVAERALSPEKKAEAAWIKAQALDERLRFLALTDIVNAQIAIAETCTEKGGAWQAGVKPEDCLGKAWVGVTSDMKDHQAEVCCKEEGEGAVTTINKFSTGDTVTFSKECSGAKSGQTFKISEIKSNGYIVLEGSNGFPNPFYFTQEQLSSCTKAVSGGETGVSGQILENAPLVGIKIGSDDSKKVRFNKKNNVWDCQADDSGMVITSWIWDWYSPCSDIQPSPVSSFYSDEYKIIATQLALKKDELTGNQYLKSIDGTTINGKKITITNPPDLSYSGSALPSPEIGIVTKGTLNRFFVKYTDNGWNCASDSGSWFYFTCSQVSSGVFTFTFSTQQREIATALSTKNLQQGYDYLIKIYNEKVLVSDITYKDNGQIKPITEIYGSSSSSTQGCWPIPDKKSSIEIPVWKDGTSACTYSQGISKQCTCSVGASCFGYDRDSGSVDRYHAGTDLVTGSSNPNELVGTEVYAVESGIVTHISKQFYPASSFPSTCAIFIYNSQNDRTINYAEVGLRQNSAQTNCEGIYVTEGQNIQVGKKIGKIYSNGESAMLHFELYAGKVTTSTQWKKSAGTIPPSPLQDPTAFLLQLKQSGTCSYDSNSQPSETIGAKVSNPAITCYNFPDSLTCTGDKIQIIVQGKNPEIVPKVCESFKVEGAGKITYADATTATINYVSGSTFQEVPAKYGLDSKGNALVPYMTAAGSGANVGKILYIPKLKTCVTGTGSTGFFNIVDTGEAINTLSKFDLFVGADSGTNNKIANCLGSSPGEVYVIDKSSSLVSAFLTAYTTAENQLDGVA